MKRVMSIILSLCLVFAIVGSVSAAESTKSEYEELSYSYKQDGNSYLLKVRKYPQQTEARLYKNDMLIQFSCADTIHDKIETQVYNFDGSLSFTQESTLSSVISTSPAVATTLGSVSSQQDFQMRYREPSIYNEPVDNTDLYISMNYQGNIYYLIGSATDSFAPEVVVSLHRTYTSTYDGETKYYTWDAGTTVSAIASVIVSIASKLVDAVLGLLEFIAGETLAYRSSVSLETFTHDYTYQGLVDGDFYYTGQRNITYWRIANLTKGTQTWIQKRYNYGYGGSNQDMVRMTAENYCRANY